MTDTLTRVSVSVWLPPAAHATLAEIAAHEGVSLAVLARRAAAAAVEAPGGRVAMPAPSVDTVEELRAAGHALNRLLPAVGTASHRCAVRCDRGAHHRGVRPHYCGGRRCAAHRARQRPALRVLGWLLVGGGWRLVRVTADPGAVAVVVCGRGGGGV